MQNPTVMAFRKRLKSLGYTEIQIKRVNKFDSNVYTVSAVEPLAGVRLCCEYHCIQMHNALHKQSRNTNQRVSRVDVVILRNTDQRVSRKVEENIPGQLSF